MQQRRTIRDFSDRPVAREVFKTWNKPFLEIAPWLIAIFAQPFRILPDGTDSPTYYTIESVGIATGMVVKAVRLSIFGAGTKCGLLIASINV